MYLLIVFFYLSKFFLIVLRSDVYASLIPSNGEENKYVKYFVMISILSQKYTSKEKQRQKWKIDSPITLDAPAADFKHKY